MHELAKHKSVLLLIIILVGLQCLFLLSYAPFLHNHPLNEPEHNFCPAFIINIELTTATILLLVIIMRLFPIVAARISLANDQMAQNINFATIPSRSPPSSF